MFVISDKEVFTEEDVEGRTKQQEKEQAEGN